MCDPVTLTVVGATMVAGAGIGSAVSQYQQGAATNKYYNALADQSVEEGKSAVKTAEAQSTAIQDTAKLEGKTLAENQAGFNASTKAALASRGIYGVTAEDIANNNFSNEQLDQLVLRNNADQKSWAVNTEGQYKNWAAKTQATEYRFAGKQAKRAGKQAAFNTLLGTAGEVASMSGGLFGSSPAKSSSATPFHGE